jgi:hypothetical protein
MKLIRLTLLVSLCLCLHDLSLAQESETPEAIKPVPEKVAAQKETAEQPAAENQAPDQQQSQTPSADNHVSFWLLGEFVGDVNESGESGKPGTRMGLQLRPVGDTDFDAQMFEGGLPGEGESFADEPNQDPKGTPREPMRLVGRRSGESLVLSGGPFAIFVDAGGCTLINPAGKKLGRLERLTRASASLGAPPPNGAIALFGMQASDESETTLLNNARLAADGTLKQGFSIKPMVQDFDLHVEFRTPYLPAAQGQRRGNSGVYIHGRYEMQVLDSFALPPQYDHLGAIYKFKAPDVNMALPPLAWQTYDIRFTSARFNSDGSKYADARVTTWVNGVKVQDDVTLLGPTGRGQAEQPLLLPILLQDHGDEVRFRNLWIIDRGLVRTGFPVKGDAKQPPLVEEEKAEEKIGSGEKGSKNAAATRPAEQTEVKKVDQLPLATPIVQGKSQELPAPIVK